MLFSSLEAQTLPHWQFLSSGGWVGSFRSPAGRGELQQEQLWLMGTHINLAEGLVPNPTSNTEPCEIPVVGDATTSDAGVILDITYSEADLSHREMILHRLVGLLLAPVNGTAEDGGVVR